MIYPRTLFSVVFVLIVVQCVAANTEDLTTKFSGFRKMIRMYDECITTEDGFMPCIKKKAISLFDRVSSMDAISITEGVKVVRLPNMPSSSPVSENELESTLARSSGDRDSKLTDMLVERISQFMNGHTIQLSLPKVSTEEIGRTLEEGRARPLTMRRMMGMMMMGGMMMGTKLLALFPIIKIALLVLVGKALFVSKLALVMAILALVRGGMSGGGHGGSGGDVGGYSSGGDHGHGGSSGWSSGGSGGHGGWNRRSILNPILDAQDLAYRSYNAVQQQPQV